MWGSASSPTPRLGYLVHIHLIYTLHRMLMDYVPDNPGGGVG